MLSEYCNVEQDVRNLRYDVIYGLMFPTKEDRLKYIYIPAVITITLNVRTTELSTRPGFNLTIFHWT